MRRNIVGKRNRGRNRNRNRSRSRNRRMRNTANKGRICKTVCGMKIYEDKEGVPWDFESLVRRLKADFLLGLHKATEKDKTERLLERVMCIDFPEYKKPKPRKEEKDPSLVAGLNAILRCGAENDEDEMEGTQCVLEREKNEGRILWKTSTPNWSRKWLRMMTTTIWE